MANKNFKKLQSTSPTPLHIVEDHNDVVPYIHRGIGSKRLPIDDIVFVHYDSHPDLLIPCDLKADDVFKKDILYEKTSIENWIIPLVYAGHISHIVWFKPPWCEQIKDKEIQFYIGKCSTTGFIRTTCKENYFVSEALYSPFDCLENKKEVKLSVVTIQPKDWTKCSGNSENGRTGPEKVYKGETGKHSCDSDDTDHAPKRHCGEDLRINNGTDKNASPPDNCQEGTSVIVADVTKRLESLYQTFKDKKFILDIDLDFFSTQNPFKLIYPEVVYNILKELYVFEKPVDLSDNEIKICNTKREGQLSELKEIFSKLQEDNNADFEHPRKDSILQLRDAVIVTEDKPDFLLLHDAGCTCDDTELPHYVSSEGEITTLVSAVQESLSYFHKPVMVTMARSSITDEYCPPDQVELIQEQTLEMLQDLYFEINVTKDYQETNLKDSILQLRDDVIVTEDKPDFLLLHDAGCTCDDTELPHYVSSEGEITTLVSAVQESLSYFHKPVMVTMARSSITDEYCPPDQVELIQEQTLEMLQDLYFEINVTKDYLESNL